MNGLHNISNAAAAAAVATQLGISGKAIADALNSLQNKNADLNILYKTMTL